jgi:hypothetical protein
MNKIVVAIAALSVGVASCGKLDFEKGRNHQERPTIVTEYTITVKAGEAKSIKLPASNKPFFFATQSQVAVTSDVTTDVYQYIAPVNLPANVVSDEVVLVTDEPKVDVLVCGTPPYGSNSIAAGGCMPGGGGSKGGSDKGDSDKDGDCGDSNTANAKHTVIFKGVFVNEDSFFCK